MIDARAVAEEAIRLFIEELHGDACEVTDQYGDLQTGDAQKTRAVARTVVGYELESFVGQPADERTRQAMHAVIEAVLGKDTERHVEGGAG